MLVISLLLKHYKAALLGAVLLFAVAMCRERDRALVEKGRAEESSRHLAQEVGSLKQRADSLQAAFKRDTVRLTRLVTKWDTVKTTDTLTKETIIAVADSTIQACHMSVRTCARALAAKDSVIAVQDSLNTLRLKHAQSQLPHERVKWSVLGILVGVAGTLLVTQ